MLLSVIETAETLGCSAQYVRKLLREGRLAGQKIGDSWIITTIHWNLSTGRICG